MCGYSLMRCSGSTDPQEVLTASDPRLFLTHDDLPDYDWTCFYEDTASSPGLLPLSKIEAVGVFLSVTIKLKIFLTKNHSWTASCWCKSNERFG